jgi:hypothetical protein
MLTTEGTKEEGTTLKSDEETKGEKETEMIDPRAQNPHLSCTRHLS